MLRECLELLQSTAVKAAGPYLVGESRDGRERMFIKPNGDVLRHDAGPFPRNHIFGALNDLVAFAARFTNPSVWHHNDGVTVLCHDGNRGDVGKMPLMLSSQFEALVEAEKQPRFSQSKFIRLLHRTLDVDPVVVLPFRRLDFQVIAASHGEFGHGKDRMGKSVQAEVKGTSAIPDEITVHVPVYQSPGERASEPVACSVDLDPQENLILFSPLPGELSKVLESRQFDIRTRLYQALGEDVNIYFGLP